ncbi:MAG TPA: DivIVA domain-containing protein [Propionicimonas sp.]|nr:DivIVA domain-containing protein [Propionicimonas sp.]
MLAGEDTTGLDLFDEMASAVGNFPQALRGYDRGAVDAYVRDVESQLARAKAQLRHQQRQLTETNARAADTDFGKAGAHTRGMLKAAESQADELVNSADSRARQVLSEAEADARRMTIEAELALDAARAATSDELAVLRQRLSEQTAAELETAKQEATALRQAAELHAAQVVADAQARAASVAEASRLESAAATAAVERTVAEAKLQLATQKEADLAELRTAQVASAAQIEKLLVDTESASAAYRAKLAEDSRVWDDRRAAALADADQIIASARAEADGIVEAAKHDGERVREDAVRAAVEEKTRVEAEVQLLVGRRQAVVDQLGELANLVGVSVADYTEGDAGK